MFTEDQIAIRDAIEKICNDFGDEYWLDRDRTGEFPEDFFQAFAQGGWLGIAMPEEYGGAGQGITEASLMMQAIAESGGFEPTANKNKIELTRKGKTFTFKFDELRKVTDQGKKVWVEPGDVIYVPESFF